MCQSRLNCYLLIFRFRLAPSGGIEKGDFAESSQKHSYWKCFRWCRVEQRRKREGLQLVTCRASAYRYNVGR